jgi:hypothetical protein
VLESGSQELDTMIGVTPILPAILDLMSGKCSSADELTDVAEALCDTIKTFALD